MQPYAVSHTSEDDDVSDMPPEVARMREERAKKAETLGEALALARKKKADIGRKRMNLQLLDMLKRPAPRNAPTSVRGIGLYTHVEGATEPPRFPHERATKGEPEFLPIGGPKSIFRKGDRVSPLDEDVAKLWNEVQNTLQKEGQFYKHSKLSPDDLKQRYAALDVPDSTTRLHAEMPTQQLQLQQQGVEMQDDIALQERGRPIFVTTDANRVIRRPSWGREATLQREGERLNAERRGSAGGNSRTTTTTVNTYEPSRDPRLARR
ncbi:hypothetical protein J1614_000361 [Plenodomus biglobosus]|nr:hypothetical protein J1614_000361 [Plenodomus biglobosus]